MKFYLCLLALFLLPLVLPKAVLAANCRLGEVIIDICNRGTIAMARAIFAMTTAVSGCLPAPLSAILSVPYFGSIRSCPLADKQLRDAGYCAS